ncbi:MAG TPA: acetyl-CoA acetyltransferase [Acidimicrobiales bacterium]
MPVDPRSPCIVGVAQSISRPEDGPSPEPLDSWELVVRAAIDDAGARDGGVLDAVESLQIVYCQSWQYDDPPDRLCDRLGIEPKHRYYSGIGGTTPQVLLDRAAESIVRGELDVAVVCGAEALDTVRRMKKNGERPQWSFKPDDKRPFPFEAPFHPAEVAHEVFQAYTTFALWDVARRAHLGVAPDDYRASIGELFAPMTDVAARNQYAWFPIARDANELVEPTRDNRMVAYPYTKYVISVMEVDLAAALVVTSHEAADRLGIPADRRVYLRGWCYATDPVYVAEHDPMWSSPAMAAASAEALRAAGTDIDDIAYLDLYSCFPSSVAFALDALGLRPDDGRGFTVTGGLPYFGGAGSDYVTHSIAQMVGVLRGDPGALGLCSGVGMHMTKHVYGVYSTSPGAAAPRPDEAAVQHGLDARPKRAIADSFSGEATIASYTVLHGRDGAPQWGLVVCDLTDGRRCYGRVTDATMLAALERDECVGRTVGLLTNDANVNEVTSWVR